MLPVAPLPYWDEMCCATVRMMIRGREIGYAYRVVPSRAVLGCLEIVDPLATWRDGTLSHTAGAVVDIVVQLAEAVPVY